MKNVTYARNSWTTTVKGDRAPNAGKNLAHGNNTLIGGVMSTLCLATGPAVYTGQQCGGCVHFGECEKTKGVKWDTDHCQNRPGRFQSANLFPCMKEAA